MEVLHCLNKDSPHRLQASTCISRTSEAKGLLVNSENIRVLIVDDQPNIRALAEQLLSAEGYTVLCARDGAEAIKIVDAEFPDLVLMDIHMPVMDGIEALKNLAGRHPAIPVIMMSGYDDVSQAVQAMKLGAIDYLKVPFDHDELIMQVGRCCEEARMKREIGRLQTILGDSTYLCELMGNSTEIMRICEQINTVAATNFTVVVYGESGSGKELVAKAIHRNSHRASGPFVPVDCGSIPESLIESELFGHERGAFTNAYQRKQGSFERASGGTLFLDEIGNLPKSMQSKLLRALQERKIERIGGSGPIAIDIRIIAAGNRRLEDLIAEGKFREDLFHRLNEFFMEVPPLRRRKEDIIYLADRFMRAKAEELNRNVRGISNEALQVLLDYDWPGNVRELRNTINRAVLLCHGIIRPQDLTALCPIRPQVSPSATNIDLDGDNVTPLKEMKCKVIEEIEREVIARVLERTGGNKSQAARILQVDYKTILSKIKKYGLEPPRTHA